MYVNIYNIKLVCLTFTREKLIDNLVRLWYNCTGSKGMLYVGTYEKVLTIQLYTIHWDFWEGITNCLLCIGIFEKVQYISILYMGTFEKILTIQLYTLHWDFWEDNYNKIVYFTCELLRRYNTKVYYTSELLRRYYQDTYSSRTRMT